MRAEDLIGLEKSYVTNEKERIVSFREKTVQNILNGIAQSKTVSFDRVLYAIGIRYVGETSAKKLAQHFRNIDGLMQASVLQLMEVEDIGEKIAESIVLYFQDNDNLKTIQSLKENGLQFSLTQNETPLSSKLQGLTFVVSGSFGSPQRRKELEDMVEKNGGKLLGAVSNKLSFLIAGENIGPAKFDKAKQLGIPIISEDEFMQLVSE